MSLPPFVWNLSCILIGLVSGPALMCAQSILSTLQGEVYQHQAACDGAMVWWQEWSGNDILTAPQPPAACCPLSYDAHLTARPGPGVLYFHTLAILSYHFCWRVMFFCLGCHVVSCLILHFSAAVTVGINHRPTLFSPQNRRCFHNVETRSKRAAAVSAFGPSRAEGRSWT